MYVVIMNYKTLLLFTAVTVQQIKEKINDR